MRKGWFDTFGATRRVRCSLAAFVGAAVAGLALPASAVCVQNETDFTFNIQTTALIVFKQYNTPAPAKQRTCADDFGLYTVEVQSQGDPLKSDFVNTHYYNVDGERYRAFFGVTNQTVIRVRSTVVKPLKSAGGGNSFGTVKLEFCRDC